MIPVYNRPDYIGLAIESVLAQTYSHFELIVHDDASTDDTLAVIHRYHDSRLRVIHTRTNHGMIGGWNYLLKQARGKYLKQMGSDDLLAPACLAQEVRALESHPSAALVTCQRQIIGEAGQTLGTYQFSNHSQVVEGSSHAHWILTNLRENKIGEPCAVLFRRRLLHDAGMFDPQFSQFADFEYWIRLLQFGDLYYLHKPLVLFRQHLGSNTRAAIADGRFICEIYALIHKYYSSPHYRQVFSLTSADHRLVLHQKTLDTLKNIKDLLVHRKIVQASRYIAQLSRGIILVSLAR